MKKYIWNCINYIQIPLVHKQQKEHFRKKKNKLLNKDEKLSVLSNVRYRSTDGCFRIHKNRGLAIRLWLHDKFEEQACMGRRNVPKLRQTQFCQCVRCVTVKLSWKRTMMRTDLKSSTLFTPIRSTTFSKVCTAPPTIPEIKATFSSAN
jgi:hypothetical protein